FGAGYVTNIADSLGFQVTNLSFPRRGFAFLEEELFESNEHLVHRAPAFNAHGEFELGPWTFITEYVGTVRSFDAANVTYNDVGASPKALHLELNRKFDLLEKPANVSVAYGHSWKALAIGLPAQRYSFVFNVSPFKNTVLSIQLSRGKNYSEGTT